MAFSHYQTIEQVQAEYQIGYQEQPFLPLSEITISPYFLTEFQFNTRNLAVFTSEAARSEAIIFPILRELYKNYYQQYSLWIQKSIRYDDKLSGTPDYLIATQSPLGKTVLATPLIAVIEAKRNDFEQGWGQCLAELVGMQKINAAPQRPVYGIVTDGRLWEFGTLVNTTFTKHHVGFTLDNLPVLFSALNGLLQMVQKREK